MLVRGLSGKLQLSTLDLKILIGDMFLKCENQEERDWLKEQLNEVVDSIHEEATEGIL